MAVLLVVGCQGTPTGPLVDLPDLEIVARPVARGGSVVVRVVNSTTSRVTLPAPLCTVRLEELIGEEWRDVPNGVIDCVGLDVVLDEGETHTFGVTIPPDRGGHYRVRIRGDHTDGAFVKRSDTFSVD